MYCKNCGKEIVKESKFCPFCGKDINVKKENNSGSEEVNIPEGVKGWSWGGFLWGWVWAIGNKTWIGLLALVPYIGLIMNIILGVHGREWAWKNKKWDSIEQFKRIQKNWVIAWFVIGILPLIAILSVAILATINPIEQSNKAKDATIKNNSAELLAASERYYAVNSFYPWDNEKESITAPYITEDVSNGIWLNKLVSTNELNQTFIDKIKTSENKIILFQEEGNPGNSYFCFQPNSESVKEEAKNYCITPDSITNTYSEYLCVENQEFYCIP